MPKYIANAKTAQVCALYPGDTLTLVNNAASDSGVTKTIQFALSLDTMGNYRLSVVNGTNQDCTIQAAAIDADVNYLPYSSQGVSTISAGTSTDISVSARWVRFAFVTAPTTGSLTVTR